MNQVITDCKAVGFDVDGVLFFPKINEKIPKAFCQAIANELELPEEEVIEFYNNNISQYKNSPTTMKSFCKGRLPNKTIDNIFLDILEEHEELVSDKAIPNLRELFIQLQAEYKLFLATGNRQNHAKRKLESIGLDENLFSATAYGCEEDKRNGSIFYDISRQLGTPLGQMLYVGDNEETDIIPAKSIGLKTVKIAEGPNTPSAATIQVYQVSDLRSILL